MNLHRVPYGGRNYEYQSEDPYLSGVMAVEQIKGIQANGIHANAKHFAVNEQETQRRQLATVVPPRALHELYLLPFEMAVKDAQPASVMCAFPEINGVSACSSEDLLKTTLREQWGFKGYVVTDRRVCTTSRRRSKPESIGSSHTSSPISTRSSRNAGSRETRERRNHRSACRRQYRSGRHRPDAPAPLRADVQVRALRDRLRCALRGGSGLPQPMAWWLARSPSKELCCSRTRTISCR